jgi:hypothetical protein
MMIYSRYHGCSMPDTSSGAGDLSVWEFSGYEPYYVVYDHFVGDPNCIHVIVFRANDPLQTQLDQLTFWLDFLRARIAPAEPIGQLRVVFSHMTLAPFCVL